MPHWSLLRSAASVQLMIALAREHGVALETCVAGTSLDEGDLREPTREIEGQQELAVLRNILRAIDPEVPFALLAGMRYHTTTQGMWGFAVMSCPTVRTAIDLGVRYFDLSLSFNRLRLEFKAGEPRLIYEDEDNPDDLRAALVERDLGAMLTFERDMLGRVFPARAVRLRGRRPPYAIVFETLFGVTPQFGAELNYVAFDPAVLDIPQPLADARALRESEDQCRLLMERRSDRLGIAGRVRERILRKPGEFPSMKRVAADLGVSTRTLRNRLGREATSYRGLVEKIRESLAEELLATTHLTVDEVADRLGYSDTSSFTTAFKRWKGVTPRGYREIGQR